MLRIRTLEDKEDLASAKRYAWADGFRAGQEYGAAYAAWLYRNATPEPPKEPKNPWYLLIFRHYLKRWKRGER